MVLAIKTQNHLLSYSFAHCWPPGASANPPEILLDWNFNQNRRRNRRDGRALVIGPDADGVPSRTSVSMTPPGMRLPGPPSIGPNTLVTRRRRSIAPVPTAGRCGAGEGSAGLGNLASLDAITHSNTSFSVWTRVKFLGQSDPKNNDVILGRPGRWYLTRQVVRNRLMVNFQAELFDRFSEGGTDTGERASGTILDCRSKGTLRTTCPIS